MEKEYKISTGYKVFYGLMAVCIAVVGAFLLTQTSTSSNPAIRLTISLIIFGVAALIVLYVLRRRVTVSDTEVTVAGLFGRSKLI